MCKFARSYAVLATLIAAGLAISGCTSAADAPAVGLTQRETTPEPRSVRVTATGSAEAEPDTVVLQLGAETTDEEAQRAIEDNNRRMQEVQEALADQGVEAQDIRTVQFDISIQRLQPEEGEPRFEEFQVIHVVEVRSGDIEGAGTLLQAALDAGANIVRDVRFTIDDPSELQQEARRQALESARANAEQLAAGLDAELGPPREIQESGDRPIPVRAGAAELERTAAQAPIAAGTLTVTVTVNVTFDLEVE